MRSLLGPQPKIHPVFRLEPQHHGVILVDRHGFVRQVIEHLEFSPAERQCIEIESNPDPLHFGVEIGHTSQHAIGPI